MNIDKPTMKTQPPAYEWHEIENYIEQKYNLDLRRVKNEDNERRDFWHFLLEAASIHHRGCYFRISSEMWVQEEWQREVLNLFVAEFGDHIRILMDW